MKNLLLVGFGGMIGSMLRYIVMSTVPDLLVLWVENAVGSFILGWLTGRATATGHKASILWTTGVLGSFTTFSTFSAQWFELMNDNISWGLGYGLGLTIACFVAAAIGFKVGGSKI